MRGTLVDSNVLLDLFTEDEEWLDWSAAMLADAASAGAVFINPIIYAEVSVRFPTIEELDEALPDGYFRRVELPWAAGYLAGQAFIRYRRAGGARRSPVADFYIGAHAAVSDLRLLTRDARRYRQYFPTLTLIAP
ncbi:MAG: type II toxin-antitoxin system VapC family toxin [Acidobacteria bacterium]|nr:type II toxin-antitoxin system VapC family toxin [Acidobacteriota bacterium]